MKIVLFPTSFLLTSLVMAASFAKSSAKRQHHLRMRGLGCMADINIYITNELPTDLRVKSANIDDGTWCLEGCGSGGDNHACANAQEWGEGTYNLPGGGCLLAGANGQSRDLYFGSDGGCAGVKGTLSIYPDASYANEFGLEKLSLSVNDSGGRNANDNDIGIAIYASPDAPDPSIWQVSKTQVGNPKDEDIYFTISSTATQAPLTFGNYTGYWKSVGTGGTNSYQACSTWQVSKQNTVTQSYQEGLSLEAGASFKMYTATATASASMTQTTANALTEMERHDSCLTCSATCEHGQLYSWVMSAEGSDGSTQSVESCYFRCVPNEIVPGPRCPSHYCNSNSCQCCKAVWREDTSDPVLNLLPPSLGGNCTTCEADNESCETNSDCCSGICYSSTKTCGSPTL